MTNRSPASSGYHDARRRRQHLYRNSKKNSRSPSSGQSYFPFHRLPREIIAEIFVLCLSDPDHAPRISRYTAPLLLCKVCSSWRSLAMTTPRLWNELYMKVAVPHMDENDAAALAEAWITRSGALPLALRLQAIPLTDREKVMTMVKALLDTFFRHSSRWEVIDIDLIGCPGVSFPKFGPTPWLRKFTYSTSWPISIPFPFTSCPRLTAFTWPFSCTASSNTDIPWHQLTHINMEHIMSSHQTIELLRSCPRLVDFKVEIDDDFTTTTTTTITTTIPDQDYNYFLRSGNLVENHSLQHFHLVVYQTCSTLLQSLSLPALTDFSLDTDYDSIRFISSPSVRQELLHFFTRSKCKLEKLKLADCGFSDAAILSCLKHPSCASLSELSISNVYNRPMFTDRVILSLTDKDALSENSNVLLPNLTHLSLEMCLAATPGLLGLMTLSRCLWWDKEDQMKSLSLIVRDLDDWDETFINIAKEQGLDVDITIEPYSDSEVAEDIHDPDF